MAPASPTGGLLMGVGSATVDGVEWGSVADWLMALGGVLAACATGVAALFAKRAWGTAQAGLEAQRAADARRDAELDRQAEDRRRAQAEKVWFVPAGDVTGPSGVYKKCTVINRSDGLIYTVMAAWDDEVEEPRVNLRHLPETVGPLEPGQEYTFRFDLPDPPIEDLWDNDRYYLLFGDMAGRTWMRTANGFFKMAGEIERTSSAHRAHLRAEVAGHIDPPA